MTNLNCQPPMISLLRPGLLPHRSEEDEDDFEEDEENTEGEPKEDNKADRLFFIFG